MWGFSFWFIDVYHGVFITTYMNVSGAHPNDSILEFSLYCAGMSNAMAGLPEKTTAFLGLLLQLQSCSLFAAYLLMIMLAGFWQRATSPLGLRPVKWLELLS